MTEEEYDRFEQWQSSQRMVYDFNWVKVIEYESDVERNEYKN